MDEEAVVTGARRAWSNRFAGWPRFYVLDDDHRPRAADAFEYAEWVDTHGSLIASDTVGDVTVATGFLGVAPGDVDDRLPDLFQTSCFAADGVVSRVRDQTYEAAVAGHHQMVEQLLAERGCGQRGWP